VKERGENGVMEMRETADGKQQKEEKRDWFGHGVGQRTFKGKANSQAEMWECVSAVKLISSHEGNAQMALLIFHPRLKCSFHRANIFMAVWNEAKWSTRVV